MFLIAFNALSKYNTVFPINLKSYGIIILGLIKTLNRKTFLLSWANMQSKAIFYSLFQLLIIIILIIMMFIEHVMSREPHTLSYLGRHYFDL